MMVNTTCATARNQKVRIRQKSFYYWIASAPKTHAVHFSIYFLVIMNSERMVQALDTFFTDVVEPIRNQIQKEQMNNVQLQIENGLLQAELDRKQRLLDMYEERIHELDDQVDRLSRKVEEKNKKLSALREEQYIRWTDQTISDYEIDQMMSEWHSANAQMIEQQFNEEWHIEQQIELYELEHSE